MATRTRRRQCDERLCPESLHYRNGEVPAGRAGDACRGIRTRFPGIHWNRDVGWNRDADWNQDGDWNRVAGADAVAEDVSPSGILQDSDDFLRDFLPDFLPAPRDGDGARVAEDARVAGDLGQEWWIQCFRPEVAPCRGGARFRCACDGGVAGVGGVP